MRGNRVELLPRGEVVAVKPALLSVASAATYCACSSSLLNALRAKDAAALRTGEPMTGPAWIRVGFGIRYKPRDLDDWLARTAVPCGVMESKRRTVSIGMAP